MANDLPNDLLTKAYNYLGEARKSAPDPAKLVTWSFYGLEVALQGAAGKLGLDPSPNLAAELKTAEALESGHGVAGVVELLRTLDDARQLAAYEVEESDYTRALGEMPEDVPPRVEECIRAIEQAVHK